MGANVASMQHNLPVRVLWPQRSQELQTRKLAAFVGRIIGFVTKVVSMHADL